MTDTLLNFLRELYKTWQIFLNWLEQNHPMLAVVVEGGDHIVVMVGSCSMFWAGLSSAGRGGVVQADHTGPAAPLERDRCQVVAASHLVWDTDLDNYSREESFHDYSILNCY